ncbi:hypothetical protein Nepgr_006104 [Nepenthes gracilis]|uniref:Scarecrow-like protein 9 n=1 Tax=Nepenthes gracilis TaxID=150966 RepID=A0AAD3S4X5_NEPGR|nr:hypothetical protein Nepgr_006104 [Nepenthes gracilis]
MIPSIGDKIDGNHQDDYDFSDVVLEYISQVLMKEDVEEKICRYHGPSALEATEKSLYEAIGEKYPPSQNHVQKSFPDFGQESLNVNDSEDCASYRSSSSSSGFVMSFPSSSKSSTQASYCSSESSGRVTVVSPSNSQASFSSSSNASVVTDGLVDSPVSALRVSNIFNDNDSMLQFKKGVEEAHKLLPNDSLVVELENASLSTWGKERDVTVKLESSHENKHSAEVSRGKKHFHVEDSRFVEGRGNKQSAVSSEAVVRSEMFDMVLLCSEGRNEAALREALQNGMNRSVQNGKLKGSDGGRGRGNKQGGNKDLVDLRTLLSLCAQAVASNDQRNANKLLKQIRQHSSPTGDGNQRAAYYFANGLEARLAGVGTPTYTFIVNGPTSAVHVLRAYHLYLAACPFKKISNFFANRTIMNTADKATRVHIIDFGILYGFQWPCLIQRLSSRPGGPPKLRITGIDLPQPGFRPGKRVEETGHRLADYAKSFNVPFEFNAIVKKWEAVSVEDLKIERDEVLIVNSVYKFRYLHDETVMVESPRNRVLNLIRKINPEVFIFGIHNGAYNGPFFLTRFREALFHFSALFDMLEATVPREIEERVLIEREILGRQAMNAIACEGYERIERPETFKQWHVRNERAGFRQLPLNQEIVNTAKGRVKSCYHRDFIINEDGQWLLQGWKGRIFYAISSWKPAH